jgi:hypothetical protein
VACREPIPGMPVNRRTRSSVRPMARTESQGLVAFRSDNA